MLLLQGIPQMEPLVMEAVSWAFKPTLQSVHPQEAQVLAWRESIASTLTAALYPARQYITRLQAYESWLALDPSAYVDNLQVRKHSWTLQLLSAMSAWKSWLGLGCLPLGSPACCLAHAALATVRQWCPKERLSICRMHGGFTVHLYASLPALAYSIEALACMLGDRRTWSMQAVLPKASTQNKTTFQLDEAIQ